jgi:hypothetical protein
MTFRELTSRQTGDWMRAIESCAPYDFYHLPEYHAMAEEAGEGAARLFVFTDGPHTIALPLLLRRLDGIPGAAVIGTGWWDATSVYGYPGPLASSESLPADVVRVFQAALRDRLRERHVIAVFSRTNPLLPQRALLESLGDFQCSETVSIDLTLPVAEQRAGFRRSFKEAINRLRRLGLTVVRDDAGAYFDDFYRIYTETMHRVGAADRYFFPPDYFASLREALGPRMALFMCLQDGAPVCGGLFVACHGILQYHLGGTLDGALQIAPMKLLVDEVRLWATEQGHRLLHLGGGTTADPEDPLLYFKRGFSDRRHEFAAWRWVVTPELYAVLCEEHDRSLAAQGPRPAGHNYFPAYRCPMETSEPEEVHSLVHTSSAASY